MGKRGFNLVMDWLIAVMVATLFTCWMHTWAIQTNLKALGVVIPGRIAFQGVMKDAFGMGPAVAAVYALALAIGLGLAHLLHRRLKVPALAGYALGGALAVGVTLAVMKAAMAITPIAGARNPIAFMGMVIGGAMAGVIFGFFRPKSA